MRSLCENRRWLFWAEEFFWGSAAPEEKCRGPKQSLTNSHNDRNKDGAKLLLSLITTTLTILCVLCVFFWQKHEENNIFIMSVLIPENEFRPVQTWRSLRDVISARIRGAFCAIVCAFSLRANRARDNANVTRRSHYQKSLLSDNDLAVFRAKLVIIYVDWITLLRRLLIFNNVNKCAIRSKFVKFLTIAPYDLYTYSSTPITQYSKNIVANVCLHSLSYFCTIDKLSK